MSLGEESFPHGTERMCLSRGAAASKVFHAEGQVHFRTTLGRMKRCRSCRTNLVLDGLEFLAERSFLTTIPDPFRCRKIALPIEE